MEFGNVYKLIITGTVQYASDCSETEKVQSIYELSEKILNKLTKLFDTNISYVDNNFTIDATLKSNAFFNCSPLAINDMLNHEQYKIKYIENYKITNIKVN